MYNAEAAVDARRVAEIEATRARGLASVQAVVDLLLLMGCPEEAERIRVAGGLAAPALEAA